MTGAPITKVLMPIRKALCEVPFNEMFRVRHLLPILHDLNVLIERSALTNDDLSGGLVLYEELRLGVMLHEVVINRPLRGHRHWKNCHADTLCRNFSEKALNQVQPRRAGGRKMQLEAWVLLQPGLNLRHLVVA